MNNFIRLVSRVLFSIMALLSSRNIAIAQSQPAKAVFNVTVNKPVNGSISIDPPIPADGKVEAGTVLVVAATPADGFALDSGYYATTGRGQAYHEFATPVFRVTVDRNQAIGASFIEKTALEGFAVTRDVVFAQPGVKKLKYDVYTPAGANKLPCIVIIHGGGWSSNTEDVMRGLARELARAGGYVVVNMDYRWIGTGDGDTVPNTMANLIEDVFGAIAHYQEHASQYGGDPTRIAVTGDSAGGHLSAAAINMADRIGDGGFGVKPGVYQFKPTYMPQGKSVEQVRKEITGAIKAAAPSYGVFSTSSLGRVRGGGSQSQAESAAVAPMENIPNVSQRAVPQYLLRGTVDPIIQNADVQAYADALKAAGQRVEYVQVPGASHAFFDWKPDAATKATFVRFGVAYAAKMKAFFDTIFYPK